MGDPGGVNVFRSRAANSRGIWGARLEKRFWEADGSGRNSVRKLIRIFKQERPYFFRRISVSPLYQAASSLAMEAKKF